MGLKTQSESTLNKGQMSDLASSSLLRLYMRRMEDGMPRVIRTKALTEGSRKVMMVLNTVMKKT